MTGRSGPVSGATVAGRPRKTQARRTDRRRNLPAAVEIVAAVTVGEPPAALGEVGRAAWSELAKVVPGFHDRLDGATLERYCSLLDEREMYRAALDEHGAVVSEAIVSPTGGVVGHRLTANPAEAQLRRCDKALDALSTALALSPAARARLGLSVARTVTAADRFIRQMYERKSP